MQWLTVADLLNTVKGDQMANDITTLAIEIQSQEAERNLRTFNELLTLSSQTASKMDKVRIDVDVESALAQIQALKTGYDELAASAKNIHFDTGIAPGAVASPTPSIDTETLNSLKEFFTTSAEMSKSFREEMEKFNEAISKLEADTLKVTSAGRKSSDSMRGASSVSREYAAAFRELIAAQKEMEKAIAKADADMGRVVAADADAEAVKKKLIAAQRELKQVTDELDATHRGHHGNIMELSEKEGMLKARIEELKGVYAKAKEEADKFGLKLDESAGKADNASQKYKEIKERVDSMPKDPMGNASQSTATFSEKAKLAGTHLTKLSRGFNSIAMMAGGAIPGVSGLGQAISMFGMVNPYVAATAIAIGAAVAVYQEYNDIMRDTAVAAREMASEQSKNAQSFKKEAEERTGDLDRLAVLNSYEKLYDVEKEESRKIVEKLSAAYKGLGIQYDALTGKISNLSEVTANMNEQDRKQLISEQEKAVEMARSAASTQIAESQRESVGWFRNMFTGTLGMDGGIDTSILGIIPLTSKKSAQGYVDDWYKYINSAKTLKEQIDRVNEAILTFNDIRQKGGANSLVLDAKNTSDQLKKTREALLEYKKNSDLLQQFKKASGALGGRSEEDISADLRALESKLENAKSQSLTSEEKYARNVSAIEALIEKKKELEKLDQRSKTGGEKGETAAEALLKIETELTNRTRERLQYEKQLEALTAKIEEQKRNWTMDAEGNITGRKSGAEKRAERKSQIDTLQNEIYELRSSYEQFSESDPARGHEIKRQIAEAQLKLNALQQEKIADSERAAKHEMEMAESAKKRLAEAREAYLIDQDGNIVRRKTAGELSAVLNDEIEAVKQRVSAARKRANEAAANEAAAANAEAELSALRTKQRELSAAMRARQNSLPEGEVEGDEELNQIGEQLNALDAKIEIAKRKAEEARKKAEGSGAAAELSNAESDLARLQARKLAEQEATETAKLRAEEAKRGFVLDKEGNIVREQTKAEEAELLRAEIAAQREKVSKLVAGSKERFDAEAKLTNLLRREYEEKKRAAEEAKRAAEALAASKKRAEDSKNGFVWDKKGNIVRRKNEKELEKERMREIAAAKAKVAATKAGSKERYDAEAELRRLKISAYSEKERKGGDGTFGMMKSEEKLNTNMVKGINASSAEEKALEARNFTRGADPEKKVETSLKEIEKLMVQIRDFATECQKDIDDIATISKKIENMVAAI